MESLVDGWQYDVATVECDEWHTAGPYRYPKEKEIISNGDRLVQKNPQRKGGLICMMLEM